MTPVSLETLAELACLPAASVPLFRELLDRPPVEAMITVADLHRILPLRQLDPTLDVAAVQLLLALLRRARRDSEFQIDEWIAGFIAWHRHDEFPAPRTAFMIPLTELAHLETRLRPGNLERVRSGFVDGTSLPPIWIFDPPSWQLLDGNHRLAAARELGHDSILAIDVVAEAFARARQELP